MQRAMYTSLAALTSLTDERYCTLLEKVSQSPGNREVGKSPNFEISLAKPNCWKLVRPEVDNMYLRRQELVFPDLGSGANDSYGGTILCEVEQCPCLSMATDNKRVACSYKVPT
jgi:hypothetical protein